MSYPVWPARLPRPEKSGWGISPQETRLKRRSDAGPVGYRGRFSSASDTVTLSVLLTRNEKAIFDNFFKLELGRGKRLFWMPDPSSDGWGLADSQGRTILTASGQPILIARRWLVSIGDQLPSETAVGMRFRKSWNVAVMP